MNIEFQSRINPATKVIAVAGGEGFGGVFRQGKEYAFYKEKNKEYTDMYLTLDENQNIKYILLNQPSSFLYGEKFQIK